MIGRTTPPAMIEPTSDASVSPLERWRARKRTTLSSSAATPWMCSRTCVTSSPARIESDAIAANRERDATDIRPDGMAVARQRREPAPEPPRLPIENRNPQRRSTTTRLGRSSSQLGWFLQSSDSGGNAVFLVCPDWKRRCRRKSFGQLQTPCLFLPTYSWRSAPASSHFSRAAGTRGRGCLHGLPRRRRRPSARRSSPTVQWHACWRGASIVRSPAASC